MVHTDLLRNKLMPDPFFRSNESTLQWIENADWEYRSTFQATPEAFKHGHVELVFEGLDGPAEVYLNDKLVLTANNMFREWRVEVKSQLKTGANQLARRLPFTESRRRRKIAAKDFWRQQTQTPEKSYLRKAAYEYGWDWGPRFVLSGIWRPVKLDVWDDAKISNLHIRQLRHQLGDALTWWWKPKSHPPRRARQRLLSITSKVARRAAPRAMWN